MFDFRKNSAARPFASRRQKTRLLLLVFSLGFAILVMVEAGKPSNWAWMWAGESRSRAAQPAPGDPSDRPTPRREMPKLEPGVVTIVPDEEDDGPSEDGSADRRYFPGVKPEYLRKVRDRTMSTFSAKEKDAWYNLLDVLNRSDDETLEKASCGSVGFSQLDSQSSTYRGELVTIDGHLHRAHRLPAPKNEFGIEGYHQFWIQLGGEAVVVYSLNQPEGLPEGMEVSEPVRVTGFYYKSWAYMYQENAGAEPKLNTAPVILARNITWNRKVASVETNSVTTEYLVLCIAVSVVVAATISVWVFLRSRATGAEVLVRTEPTSFESLKNKDFPSVGELVQKRLDQEP